MGIGEGRHAAIAFLDFSPVGVRPPPHLNSLANHEHPAEIRGAAATA
jgi:hypothetical protein